MDIAYRRGKLIFFRYFCRNSVETKQKEVTIPLLMYFFNSVKQPVFSLILNHINTKNGCTILVEYYFFKEIMLPY